MLEMSMFGKRWYCRWAAPVLVAVVWAWCAGGQAAEAPRGPASAATKPQRSVPPRIELTTKAAAMEQRARIAHMRLSGTILDSPPGFTLFPDVRGEATLRDWLHRLAKARKDKRIAAVAIEIDSPRMSWAQGQELADAVRRLQATKPVYAYLGAARATEYLVASAAGHVSMEPAGILNITGLSAELLFFRGTLNWLGIEPQVIQIGRFKSAAEPLTRSEPSEEMLQVYNWVLDDLYDQLCSQIATQRSLRQEGGERSVKATIDEGPLSAEHALRAGFVDELICRTDWEQFVGRSILKRRPKARDFSWNKDYARPSSRLPDLSNPFALLGMLFKGGKGERIIDPTIAIIHADGLIVPGPSSEGLFGQRLVGAKTLVDTFNRVREDGRVKAVVFRINSPGGSALASELIYQAARKCAAEKPLIVSISQVGGSGGYYIALGGRTILADASAIVGSIGVVSGKLAISGLLDKIGITRHELTRGRNAGLGMSRPWDEREQGIIREHARRVYKLFVDRVTSNRSNRIPDIDSVADGRIFTARQAVKNGLIDRVGGLRDAVAAAQRAAGIRKCHFISLPPPRTLSDLLTGDSETISPRLIGVQESLVPRWILRTDGLRYLLNLAERMDREMVLTAMPYWLSIRP